MKAVSYTHLKGMSLRTSRSAPAIDRIGAIACTAITIPASFGECTRMKTVSYTHLDVYKRQQEKQVQGKLGQVSSDPCPQRSAVVSFLRPRVTCG